MFVNLPGISKDDAFKIGLDIAKQVTLRTPEPMKLKFEKVKYFISTDVED
jgi:DNA polymerase zeta